MALTVLSARKFQRQKMNSICMFVFNSMHFSDLVAVFIFKNAEEGQAASTMYY